MPYLFAETSISFPKYLLAVSLASTPSMLLFTLMGERLAAGHAAASLALFGITLLALLLFVVFRKRIFRWIEQSAHRQQRRLN